MHEEELNRNPALAKAYEEPAESARVKPLRCLDNYELRNVKGMLENGEVLRRKGQLLLLHGTLMPGGESGAGAISNFEVRVTHWTISHAGPNHQRGIHFHSQQAEYYLRKPSKAYGPLFQYFLTSVEHALCLHSFVMNVVLEGGDDDEMELPLSLVEEMMGGGGDDNGSWDQAFAKDHGALIYQLLCELKVPKNHTFMAELRSMKCIAPPQPPRSPSMANGDAASSQNGMVGMKRSSSGDHEDGPDGKRAATSPDDTAAANVITGPKRRGRPPGSGKKAKMAALNGTPQMLLSSPSPGSDSADKMKAAKRSSSFDDMQMGEVNGPAKKRRGRPPKGRDDSSASRLKRASSDEGNHHNGHHSSDHHHHHHHHHGHHNHHYRHPPVDVSLLNLSDKVPGILDSITGHVHLMTRIMEEQRTSAVNRQLTEVSKLLDSLDAEDFKPLPYLVSGMFHEDFFTPLFELYKAIKRIRFTCPKEYLPTLAALRSRLVTKFTDVVLRDVYYMRHQADMAAEVRSKKEKEKEKWIEEKRKRLERERERERQRRAEERERKHKELVVRREARAKKEEEWRVVHEERKESRRQQLALLGLEMNSVKHAPVGKKRRRRQACGQEHNKSDEDSSSSDNDDDEDQDSDIGSDVEGDGGDVKKSSSDNKGDNSNTEGMAVSGSSLETGDGSEGGGREEEGVDKASSEDGGGGENKGKEEQSRGVLDALELNGDLVPRTNGKLGGEVEEQPTGDEGDVSKKASTTSTTAPATNGTVVKPLPPTGTRLLSGLDKKAALAGAGLKASRMTAAAAPAPASASS